MNPTEEHKKHICKFISSDLNANLITHDTSSWCVVGMSEVSIDGSRIGCYNIHIETPMIAGGGVAIVPEKAGKNNAFLVAAAPDMFNVLINALKEYIDDGYVSDNTIMKMEQAVKKAAPRLEKLDDAAFNYARKG